MRLGTYIGVLTIGAVLCSFELSAQTNTRSVTVYSGGVSTSPVFQIGSYPKQFAIYRDSYWTDSRGCVTSWIGNPKGIQPGDKHHVDTRVYLYGTVFTIPLPPMAVGAFAAFTAGALLSMVAFLAGCYARNRTGAISPPTSRPEHREN